MAYTQSTMFSEGPARHEEPEEKLWRTVIQLAAQEAKRDQRAAAFFSSETWKIVSREMLCRESILKFETAFARPMVELTVLKSDKPEQRNAAMVAREEQRPARERTHQETRAMTPKRASMTPEVRKERDRDRCREKKRAATNYYERRELGFVQPARKQDDPAWHEARAAKKRTASRERYRLKVGFYDRQPATAAVCDGA